MKLSNEIYKTLQIAAIEVKQILSTDVTDFTAIKQLLFNIENSFSVLLGVKEFKEFIDKHSLGDSYLEKIFLTMLTLSFYWPDIKKEAPHFVLKELLAISNGNTSEALDLFFNSNLYKKGFITLEVSKQVTVSVPLMYNYVCATEKLLALFYSSSDNRMVEVSSPIKLKDVVLSTKQREKVKTMLTLFDTDLLKKYKLDSLVAYGKGNVMLLHGPPGTGKTLLAQAIAGELNYNFVKVDYSQFLSKWYSESLNNLAAILNSYRERKDVIIMFDEADALFIERAKTDAGTDIENQRLTNYLLNFLEEYEGYIVLTTNMLQILDPAVERRIRFKVEMPIPKKEERVKLWKLFLKGFKKKYLYKDLGQYIVTGGDIKNIILEYIRRVEATPRKIESQALLIEAIKFSKPDVQQEMAAAKKVSGIQLRV